jgi:hypothetical protein
MRSTVGVVKVQAEVGVVCDPLEDVRIAAEETDRSVASRPRSLDGKVLAVIDNGFYRQGSGMDLGDALVERIREVARLADVIYVRKDAVNVPPRPEDWQEVCHRGDVGLTLYGA